MLNGEIIDVEGTIFEEVETARAKSTHFNIEVSNLVVSLPSGMFTAVYYKAAGRPHLILRERSKTDDHELLAEAFQAAVGKARELGWIV
jgi:hypothetical protein